MMFTLLKKSFQSWQDDNAMSMAAALSYYTIFSIAPLLFILIFLIGIFYGPQAAQGQIVMEIQNTVGSSTALFVQTLIKNIYLNQTGMTAIIGILTLILAALGVFSELRISLNRIWHVEKKKENILFLLKNHFIAFIFILGFSFVLIVSFVMTTFLSVIGKYFGDIFSLSLPTLEIINTGISFLLISFLFSFVFKFIPRIKISWQHTLIGGFFTGFLFTIGKLVIGFYIGKINAGSLFGTAGSLIILLLWIYYSSLIFFFGAEFTKEYSLQQKT